MNWQLWAVAAIVAVSVAWALWRTIRRYKRRKTDGCSDQPSCCGCPIAEACKKKSQK